MPYLEKRHITVAELTVWAREYQSVLLNERWTTAELNTDATVNSIQASYRLTEKAHPILARYDIPCDQ